MLSKVCGDYSVSRAIFSSHLYEILKLSTFNNDESDQDWSLQPLKENSFISASDGLRALKLQNQHSSVSFTVILLLSLYIEMYGVLCSYISDLLTKRSEFCLVNLPIKHRSFRLFFLRSGFRSHLRSFGSFAEQRTEAVSCLRAPQSFPKEIIKKTTHGMWERVEWQWSEEELKYLSQVLLKP